MKVEVKIKEKNEINKWDLDAGDILIDKNNNLYIIAFCGHKIRLFILGNSIICKEEYENFDKLKEEVISKKNIVNVIKSKNIRMECLMYE